MVGFSSKSNLNFKASRWSLSPICSSSFWLWFEWRFSFVVELCLRIGLLSDRSKFVVAFLRLFDINSARRVFLRASAATEGCGVDGSEDCANVDFLGESRVMPSRERSSLSEIAALPDNSE